MNHVETADYVRTSVVALPLANEAFDDKIITVLELEEIVIAGMTFGAWFKVGLAIALGLLVIERTINIYKKIRNKND